MKSRKGSLEVVAGCMFSGKTEELMRLVRRAEYAKQAVITIKHRIDNRVHTTCINSHAGRVLEAAAADDVESLRTAIPLDIEVVAIDEVQFFPLDILSVIEELVDRGVRVIAAGLDTDFRGQPFGIMPHLMTLADSVHKLSAICMQCGKDARWTQRLVNGKPADWHDPLIQVGAEDSYEARCRTCFSINRPVDFYAKKAQGLQKHS
ncbi:MAG: thymidine kinase [Candidatus Dependentiae bacterium]|nr:thymidine kinase [Candidatus Dependentiae bacterium]